MIDDENNRLSHSLSEMMNLPNNNTSINIADAQTPLINEENAHNDERHVIKNKLGTINGCYRMYLLYLLYCFFKPLFLLF